MKGRNPLFAEGLVDLTCIITWVLYGGVDFSELVHCRYACKSCHVFCRLLSQLANVYFTRKFSISSKCLDLLT